MGKPAFKKKYTYQDYLTWPEGEWAELIYGEPVYMSADPLRKHQVVSRQLLLRFGGYLEDKTCEIYESPFDVQLFAEDREDDEIDTVVQPDLSVFCDLEKLDDKGAKGTPDLVIEILSPSTARMDKVTKKELYEKAGVKEYWVVDPLNELVEVYSLEENRRYDGYYLYTKKDSVKVNLFSDLEIDLGKVFL